MFPLNNLARKELIESKYVLQLLIMNGTTFIILMHSDISVFITFLKTWLCRQLQTTGAWWFL